jgi:hypothetical protein
VDESFAGPTNLGAAINSEFIDESPCLSADGLILYFVSHRPPGGNVKIFVARRPAADRPWESPEPLGSEINSSSAQYHPWLSRDGLVLTFTTLRSGRDEVFVSRRRSTAEPFEHAGPLGGGATDRGIGSV